MNHSIRLFVRIVSKVVVVAGLLFSFTQCKDKSVKPGNNGTDTTTTPAFDINTITDTYASLANDANYLRWGPYNVHDPSILKIGNTYYCYSTDAAYGGSANFGIPVRQSTDLVKWNMMGWAVSNKLPQQAVNYIKPGGKGAFNSIWAPYIMQVGSELRLYYSLTGEVPRLSAIGLLTATNPLGPWTERGLAVVSKDDASIQTNAIDPTVLVTPAGEHWMYYGSAWDGIYALQLDPSTGLAKNAGDKGKRVANRGFTNGKYNGNIEGPEIIYNPELKKYFLFIAYDWLGTKYNVRVMRADSPQGPFYDFNGADANTNVDHYPMIVAPYQFMGHGGWQGTAHCSVFSDGNGQFYMAHQGRPSVDASFMVLHVRKIFWTKDGWPVVSPQRYAATQQTAFTKEDLIGDWEQIHFNTYRVVPGYGDEQTSPDTYVATALKLNADGTFSSDAANKWTYTAPDLELTWSNGTVQTVHIERGRDWENKKETLVFSGLDNQGFATWGKKK